MPRFLARLLGQRAPAAAPAINRAKPGPSRRQRERQKIIETAREMRFAMGMEWRL